LHQGRQASTEGGALIGAVAPCRARFGHLKKKSTWRLRQVLDSSTGIDGYRYLRTMLVELPKAKTVEDFEALLPWRLATAER